jgi:predicted AAA+ superfamily ATPase
LIERSLSKHLSDWKKSPSRQPLILRGARQVGKTTLINEFGKSYDQYLYFNLERKRDKDLINQTDEVDQLIQLLFLTKGYRNDKSMTSLIFIDEVQEVPKVLEWLRYFKEDFPEIHLIVSGSLLEFSLQKIHRVSVGRVEYLELHPISFREYLQAIGSQVLVDQLDHIETDSAILSIYFEHFHRYALIGGMPGILSAFLEEKDVSRVRHLYAGIIESYIRDVEKYATNESQRQVIRHILETAPYEIDNRVNLNNFGGSNFRTREIKEAFTALSYARLLQLIYPTTRTELPIVPDFKKRPRLHFLDVGLVNYQLGLHKELLTIRDLHDSSRGKLVQQIINQEIQAQNYLPGEKRAFWVREDRGSTSEVDVVFQHRNLLVPIEIKSGASGTLRSLHEYIDRCPHHIAIRFYGGSLRIDELRTRKDKPYRLLNLPYFLAGWLNEYLDWFLTNAQQD